MTHVVVNGDDLGIAHAVNAAIERAFREGILTSASVMANMPAFEHAVEGAIARNPGLGIGIHLVLTSGAPVSKPGDVPLLVDKLGAFRHGFVGVRRLVRGPHAATAAAQIERELRAQCEKVMARGLRFDHMDGHRYIHMIPEIWKIVIRLAAEYECPYVRLADEKWPGTLLRRDVAVVARNFAKKLLLSSYAHRNRAQLSQSVPARSVRTADWIVGILHSGAMTSDTLEAALTRASTGITEIVVHPGLPAGEPGPCASELSAAQGPCDPMDVRFLSSSGRRLELEALTSPSVAGIAARRGINLTSFGQLAAETPRAA
jgi:chitin disaccharide deacetylase